MASVLMCLAMQQTLLSLSKGEKWQRGFVELHFLFFHFYFASTNKKILISYARFGGFVFDFL